MIFVKKNIFSVPLLEAKLASTGCSAKVEPPYFFYVSLSDTQKNVGVTLPIFPISDTSKEKNWGLTLTEHPVVANYASRRATEKIFYTKIIRI